MQVNYTIHGTIFVCLQAGKAFLFFLNSSLTLDHIRYICSEQAVGHTVANSWHWYMYSFHCHHVQITFMACNLQDIIPITSLEIIQNGLKGILMFLMTMS